MPNESLVTIPPPEDTDQEQESTSEEGSKRPEWLPEKYWDEDNAQAKVQELVTNLVDTQTALRNRKEEMREEVKGELMAGRPEDPDGYKIQPETWNLPDGSFSVIESDPMVGKVKQWAHKYGVTQDAFNELLSTYTKTTLEAMPDKKKEKEALGENAADRLTRVGSFAGKALAGNQEYIDEFTRMTMTAKGVEVIEQLIDFGKKTGPQSFVPTEGTIDETKEELDRIMSSDAYWSRDIATINKATRLQERLAKYKKTA